MLLCFDCLKPIGDISPSSSRQIRERFCSRFRGQLWYNLKDEDRYAENEIN
jgi:hypothetical protein